MNVKCIENVQANQTATSDASDDEILLDLKIVAEVDLETDC